MVANTPRDLLRGLDQDPVLGAAREGLAQNREARRQLLLRATEVYERDEPRGYLHSGDLPLAAYLYMLGELPDRRTLLLIRRVAQEDRRRFRAAHDVAQHRLTHQRSC